MDAIVSPEYLWIVEGLLFSLALGLLMSAVVGIAMLAMPDRLFAINDVLSRWIDTRGKFAELDRPRSLERTFYRYHRLTGALITLGAGFVLWEWTFAYRQGGVFGILGGHWSSPELSWIVSAGEWIVVGLHLVILFIGLVVLIRPSLLKGLEARGNRWHDAKLSDTLDRPIGPLDRKLRLHPRLAGLFLLLAATWCLSGLLPVIGRLLA